MSRILLGVAGGIAAYKACLLLRRFTEAGHEVTVVAPDRDRSGASNSLTLDQPVRLRRIAAATACTARG